VPKKVTRLYFIIELSTFVKMSLKYFERIVLDEYCLFTSIRVGLVVVGRPTLSRKQSFKQCMKAAW